MAVHDCDDLTPQHHGVVRKPNCSGPQSAVKKCQDRFEVHQHRSSNLRAGCSHKQIGQLPRARSAQGGVKVMEINKQKRKKKKHMDKI